MEVILSDNITVHFLGKRYVSTGQARTSGEQHVSTHRNSTYRNTGRELSGRATAGSLGKEGDAVYPFGRGGGGWCTLRFACMTTAEN